jgi:N-acetylmuramoyl-L-alanine amidase
VYYISTSVDDSKRAISAAQDAALDFDRSCFADNSFNLKAILWDMVYTSNRAESIELARSICRSINRDLDARILGIKGARFYILKGVRMPAVLVEVGFLSNPDEERMLRNSYYRQKVAESIAAAVGDYARDTVVFAQAR